MGDSRKCIEARRQRFELDARCELLAWLNSSQTIYVTPILTPHTQWMSPESRFLSLGSLQRKLHD